MTMMIPNWKVDLYFLIIAHPDDESMFFYPTIHHLTTPTTTITIPTTTSTSMTTPETNPNLHIVCLSNGNYNHLGHVREKELYKACHDILGLPHPNIHIVNDPNMPDDPNIVWDATVVADTIERLIYKQCHFILQSQTQIQPNINTHPNQVDIQCRQEQNQNPILNVALLTFDSGGVSGHANHVDTWKGVWKFLSRNRGEDGNTNINGIHLHVRAFQLETIYFPLRKYIPPLDWIFLAVHSFINYWFYLLGRISKNTNNASFQTASFQPVQVWRAMAAHASQFVWYRKLSVLWSRYSYVNTWNEINYNFSDDDTTSS